MAAAVPPPYRHHTLSVLVENKAGVLARVSGLFARRGYNIYSLAVAPTDDERFSRITVVVDVESAPLEQITKQLFKLIHVVKISELDPGQAVERELMITTVRAEAGTRSQVIELVDVFQGRIVDVGVEALTVELAGPPSPSRLNNYLLACGSRGFHRRCARPEPMRRARWPMFSTRRMPTPTCWGGARSR